MRWSHGIFALRSSNESVYFRRIISSFDALEYLAVTFVYWALLCKATDTQFAFGAELSTVSHSPTFRATCQVILAPFVLTSPHLPSVCSSRRANHCGPQKQKPGVIMLKSIIAGFYVKCLTTWRRCHCGEWGEGGGRGKSRLPCSLPPKIVYTLDNSVLRGKKQ